MHELLILAGTMCRGPTGCDCLITGAEASCVSGASGICQQPEWPVRQSLGVPAAAESCEEPWLCGLVACCWPSHMHSVTVKPYV
jgi:hypothetical protein